MCVNGSISSPLAMSTRLALSGVTTRSSLKGRPAIHCLTRCSWHTPATLGDGGWITHTERDALGEWMHGVDAWVRSHTQRDGCMDAWMNVFPPRTSRKVHPP